MAAENGIMSMTAEEVQAQRERYPRAFSETLAKRMISWVSYLVLLSVLLYAMNRFGFFSERFYGSFEKLAIMADQMFPPTTGGQFPDYVDAILETLAMAFIGSLIGGLLALPFAFMAAKNFNSVRPLQFSVRRFADILRAADYMIW